MSKPRGKPFKPGNPGGPGRPNVPEDIKAARQLNSVEFERIVNKYLYMTGGELMALVESTEAPKRLPAIEMMLVSIIAKSINDGDQQRLNFILDRIIGRVPVKVSIPIPDDGPRYVREISGMTDEEVRAERARILAMKQ